MPLLQPEDLHSDLVDGEIFQTGVALDVEDLQLVGVQVAEA